MYYDVCAGLTGLWCCMPTMAYDMNIFSFRLFMHIRYTYGSIRLCGTFTWHWSSGASLLDHCLFVRTRHVFIPMHPLFYIISTLIVGQTFFGAQMIVVYFSYDFFTVYTPLSQVSSQNFFQILMFCQGRAADGCGIHQLPPRNPCRGQHLDGLQGWIVVAPEDSRWPSWVPSGYVNSLLLKMAIEIVDFPIKNGDFP
jgi:hypothetical protein